MKESRAHALANYGDILVKFLLLNCQWRQPECLTRLKKSKPYSVLGKETLMSTNFLWFSNITVNILTEEHLRKNGRGM